MISLLLVDDDVLFVDRIRKTVHFDRAGIDTVLAAHSMRQALDLLEQTCWPISRCPRETGWSF